MWSACGTVRSGGASSDHGSAQEGMRWNSELQEAAPKPQTNSEMQDADPKLCRPAAITINEDYV